MAGDSSLVYPGARSQDQLAAILEMVGCLTDFAPPIVTMLSYAIIFRHGLERYVADARAAGVVGAIVPDLPVEEAGPLADICRARISRSSSLSRR